LQGGAFAFDDSRFSRLAHQLVDGRHFFKKARTAPNTESRRV